MKRSSHHCDSLEHMWSLFYWKYSFQGSVFQVIILKRQLRALSAMVMSQVQFGTRSYYSIRQHQNHQVIRSILSTEVEIAAIGIWNWNLQTAAQVELEVQFLPYKRESYFWRCLHLYQHTGTNGLRIKSHPIFLVFMFPTHWMTAGLSSVTENYNSRGTFSVIFW